MPADERADRRPSPRGDGCQPTRSERTRAARISRWPLFELRAEERRQTPVRLDILPQQIAADGLVERCDTPIRRIDHSDPGGIVRPWTHSEKAMQPFGELAGAEQD